MDTSDASAAARQLGRIKTPRKAAASAANIAAANATRPRLACTCGRSPHAARCPVGRRERYEAQKAAGRVSGDAPPSE